MTSFTASGWPDIDALRSEVNALSGSATLQAASQAFVELFTRRFSTAVLARLFAVVPFKDLPAAEQTAATAAATRPITPHTPILSLLGTSGREEAWRDRQRSRGHRAIPLLSSASVNEIPMVARLLSELGTNLGELDLAVPVLTREMLGGRNRTFFVPDAQLGTDVHARLIISARDFVQKFKVRTVFGMGGAYANGLLVVAIVFTDELIDRLIVDRFPSLIGNFKMATEAVSKQATLFPV